MNKQREYLTLENEKTKGQNILEINAVDGLTMLPKWIKIKTAQGWVTLPTVYHQLQEVELCNQK